MTQPNTDDDGTTEAVEYDWVRGCGCALLFVLIPLVIILTLAGVIR